MRNPSGALVCVSLLIACGGDTGNSPSDPAGPGVGPVLSLGDEASNGTVPSGPGGVPVDLAEGSEAGPSRCIELTVGFEVLTPTVVVLVDRSSSMNDDFGNGDRWGVLRDTLIDPASGIIAEHQDNVEFGLTMYTSRGGNEEGEVCPLLVEVDAAPQNFNAIRNVYSMTATPDGRADTPTAESVQAVAEQLANLQRPGPKILILATDGDPDTCADARDHSRDSQILSEQAVEEAFQRGVQTFVISVGEDVTQAHLQNLANLGVGAQLGAREPYYEGNDPDSLADAFRTIVTGVLPCEFQLDGTIGTEDAPQGSIRLDETPLDYGEEWEVRNESTVRLLGDACTSFQEGGHQIDIAFPCGFSIE